ncbi:phage tail protein [Escherichia coli]|uniref:phage tail protein n=1 Tax=Escherichia coli TaxID=562 RepID=UPI0020342255|nr:phage tail protein [Escherichia coli]
MQNLMPPINTPDQLFHDGDPTQGIEGTLVTAGYLNNQQGATRDLQQELLNVLGGAHIQPDPKKTDQLLTALRALLLSRKNPFGDIKSDGTVKTALENLGLGEGSALPVGVPVPWPSATPPTGWLKCNGAPFSAEEYPKLAKAYPKLKLPDLRGEFIRGWDDGRGVDSARLLLSSQAASILEHNHEMHGWTGNPLMARDVYSSGSSVFAVQLSIGDGGLLYSWKDGSGTTNDSKRMDRTNHVSSGAGDGSPRNIAFNYIVRAA